MVSNRMSPDCARDEASFVFDAGLKAVGSFKDSKVFTKQAFLVNNRITS